MENTTNFCDKCIFLRYVTYLDKVKVYFCYKNKKYIMIGYHLPYKKKILLSRCKRKKTI